MLNLHQVYGAARGTLPSGRLRIAVVAVLAVLVVTIPLLATQLGRHQRGPGNHPLGTASTALPPSPLVESPSLALLPSPSAVVAHGVPAVPWFGILRTSGQYSGQERQAGVTVAHLALNWSQYEPSPGAFDSGYVTQQRQKLAGLRQAGFGITLDAGLQYPPGWVFEIDASTRFVNQYGDIWRSGTLGEDVPNAVFDPGVRAAEADYIARIAGDFGDAFFAVRMGGLGFDELRYPNASFNGHSNCYWAFDANAQAGSPVPGWKPGMAGQSQAASFYSYYAGKLRDYQNWQTRTYRSHFSGWLEVLYPSWGLRPGDIQNAVASNLDGSTQPADSGTLEMGLDWSDQVASISDRRTIVYTTWLDRADDGSTPNTQSPVRYLLSLARPKGLSVAGENSGDNTYSDLRLAVARTKSLPLAGMMWLSESQLVGGGSPSLGQYGSLIRS